MTANIENCNKNVEIDELRLNTNKTITQLISNHKFLD